MTEVQIYICAVSAVAECKECFTLFDKNGDGRIAVNDLGTVVRSLGMNPTESEVREVVRSTLRKSNALFNITYGSIAGNANAR